MKCGMRFKKIVRQKCLHQARLLSHKINFPITSSKGSRVNSQINQPPASCCYEKNCEGFQTEKDCVCISVRQTRLAIQCRVTSFTHAEKEAPHGPLIMQTCFLEQLHGHCNFVSETFVRGTFQYDH